MNFDIKKIKAIIGLGNPGLKYYKNRHNIGFKFIDKIAQKYFVSWSVADNMEYSQIQFDLNEEINSIILIKPQTFMNESGKVIPFLCKKGITAENILVIHDELEKNFGSISFKFGGSARGHNGLRSIISILGYDFWRLRFGIGRPENPQEVGNYVLTNFSQTEETQIDFLIEETVQKIFQ